jgi:hypothetical protein
MNTTFAAVIWIAVALFVSATIRMQYVTFARRATRPAVAPAIAALELATSSRTGGAPLR